MSQWNLNEGNEPVGPEAGNCPPLQDIPVPPTRPSPLALGPDGARGGGPDPRWICFMVGRGAYSQNCFRLTEAQLLFGA